MPPKQTSPAKTGYLVLYNAVSAAAWSSVLYHTVAIAASQGPRYVHPGIGQWTKWTQTAAALEILHSLFGIVRAPLLTTLMQVASRLLLVWGIVHPFPAVALSSDFYTSMLVAWSVTEVIRYSFFALGLLGWQPRLLTWLRYNTFFVLYPLGISSECALIYQAAVGPAGEVSDPYKWGLYAVLAAYVPGAFTLYTYMMKQRRKVMRGLQYKEKKDAQ
ncbi:very-long-chain-like protein [Hapsidospora chrysogenum ATCC 11550]|uniref:Very-long-chain (3R)-3-hydroxyacyl-CoA dehydratase n=1 Tax=Hapsidospora chrysogenum (strain ATCC 11550 / CBS 779.69 / DSM 880 / IAM 14645 / JCM 23072 / IMI 49137) TaxID=857340 RepID=A0A086THU0_HAPC1|nr:very-long-chain-like protein [Hapsidospora chrysogenum ATCC 11550]